MQPFVLTPAAGKRLIAKAIVRHDAVRAALSSGTVVVVAGTTNAYVAEEILSATDAPASFSRRGFYRGLTKPPAPDATPQAAADPAVAFPGDVVLVKGSWQPGKTLFDVADELREGDVVLKGANALDLARRQAAILIGHPRGGTILAALQALIGRRTRLLLPVGVEKRVPGDLQALAARVNQPGATGPRLLPVPGEVFTELEALALLTGASAELVAAGGVGGAEGAVWLSVSGTPEQEQAAAALLASVGREPRFVLS